MGDVSCERKLGRYILLRLLARGGMSEVYLACDEARTQNYALKLVYQEHEEYYLRFQREVRLQSALQHPHILPILDYGEQDGAYYCVMPYIEHGTLKDRITQHPLDFYDAESILTQIADALQFIHEAGLIHRDIKPANILLDEETNHVWLADFGLVKELDGVSGLTGTGCLIGTPFYLAPELLEKPASISSDLYALGVVLYEMITGKIPFTGKTPLIICLKHLHELPQPPSTFIPSLPPAVERVILRALKKNPAARFANARSLAEAFSQALTAKEAELLNNTSISIEIKPLSELSVKKHMRPRTRLIAAGMVAASAIFTLFFACLSASYAGRNALPNSAAQMISVPQQIQTAPTPGSNESNSPGRAGVSSGSHPNPPQVQGKPKPVQIQGDDTGKHHKPKHGPKKPHPKGNHKDD